MLFGKIKTKQAFEFDLVNYGSENSLNKLIATKMQAVINHKKDALFGIGKSLDLNSIFANLNSKDFEQAKFAILTEEIENSQRKNFNKLSSFFDAWKINQDNIWFPIESMDQKKCQADVQKYSKKIIQHGFCDLLLLDIDFTNNQIGLIDKSKIKKNFEETSFYFQEDSKNFASIGLKEIVFAKKIIIVIKNEDQLEKLNDLKKIKHFDKNNPLSALLFAKNKIDVFFHKEEQIDVSNKKDSVNSLLDVVDKNQENEHGVTITDGKIELKQLFEKPRQVQENSLINTQKTDSLKFKEENSVFYEDKILNNEKELKLYQESLKNKVMQVKEKTQVLKNATTKIDLEQKEDTVKIQAKILDIEKAEDN